ncbi:DNA-directed RNA polymerase subunit beta [Halalkalibacter oceani]|uniref:DNA-directed RNA polymerase subunit beta n=1 Tax=Halalkalibacter oceani TaxID=1653776 RepID=A0A9X2INL5_9BACI|nr:DNA-directed RNA polymerase subunit beta [Halalkalibacter oceani]MCM3714320.1 DNA-directed RNA polymerase subunit beta [Halalkalibacter oceani]
MTEQDSRLKQTKRENAVQAGSAKPKSREERRLASGDEHKSASGRKSRRRPRLRLIPIWLRILLSIVLIGGSLLLGLIVGYGVIGDGDPADALKPETWYHILDIIRGE